MSEDTRSEKLEKALALVKEIMREVQEHETCLEDALIGAESELYLAISWV